MTGATQPPSPSLASSKPITGILIVKGKREGFRYPTTLPNYQQELPIGTDVVVWRDGGEAIGKVIGYVSVWQMIPDHQLVLKIKENGLTADAGGLMAVPGDSTFEYSQLRSPSSSTLCTEVGQQPRTSELGREYNRSAAHDVQETLREIFGAEEQPARLLRKATTEDRATWTRRQEEERERLQKVKDVFIRSYVINGYGIAPQGHAAGVEDVECQLDGKKMTVYLVRQNPTVKVNFTVAQRRVHKVCKCRVDIRYLDEVTDDNDDPVHIERVQGQRREAEAARQAYNKNNSAASQPRS